MKSVFQEWWIWKSFVEIPWLECKSEWRGWSSQVKTETGYFKEKITDETGNFSSKYLKELPILTQPWNGGQRLARAFTGGGGGSASPRPVKEEGVEWIANRLYVLTLK